ncbi:MAG: hypothetical protein ABFD50_04595 [Smithella sp.]
MSKINLEDLFQYTADGFVNSEATLESLREKIEQIAFEHNKNLVRVEEVVNMVFDAGEAGKPITMTTLEFECMKVLNPSSPAEHGELREAIHTYVKKCARFTTKKGPSGGIFRS